MARGRFPMIQIMPTHLCGSGGFRGAFRVSADISRMHFVLAMIIELADDIKSSSALGAAILVVFVLFPEVIVHRKDVQGGSTSRHCTIERIVRSLSEMFSELRERVELLATMYINASKAEMIWCLVTCTVYLRIDLVERHLRSIQRSVARSASRLGV